MKSIAISVGASAVDFQLPSTAGQVTLGQYRGRPLLLAFFSMAFTPV